MVRRSPCQWHLDIESQSWQLRLSLQATVFLQHAVYEIMSQQVRGAEVALWSALQENSSLYQAGQTQPYSLSNRCSQAFLEPCMDDGGRGSAAEVMLRQTKGGSGSVRARASATAVSRAIPRNRSFPNNHDTTAVALLWSLSIAFDGAFPGCL